MTALARTPNRIGTWLALLAMCLIVFAPLVSQMSASARAASPDAALCSASAPGHDMHASVASDPLAACGYCNLLATPAAPPPLVPPTPSWLALPTAIVIVPALRVAIPALSYFAGYPRAPPSAA